MMNNIHFAQYMARSHNVKYQNVNKLIKTRKYQQIHAAITFQAIHLSFVLPINAMFLLWFWLANWSSFLYIYIYIREDRNQIDVLVCI